MASTIDKACEGWEQERERRQRETKEDQEEEEVQGRNGWIV